MLQATKAQVLTEFHLDSLSVRFMEVEYLLMVFNRLAAVAGILAGFASTGILECGLSEAEEAAFLPFSRSTTLSSFSISMSLYIFFCGSALGSLLVVLLITTLTTMWGPGRALRGKGQEAIHDAVAKMDSAAKWAFSSIISVCIHLSFIPCVVALIVLSVGSYFLYSAGREVVMELTPHTVITGIVQGNPMRI